MSCRNIKVGVVAPRRLPDGSDMNTCFNATIEIRTNDDKAYVLEKLKELYNYITDTTEQEFDRFIDNDPKFTTLFKDTKSCQQLSTCSSGEDP